MPHFRLFESVNRPLDRRERAAFSAASAVLALAVAATLAASYAFYFTREDVVYKVGPYVDARTSSPAGSISFQLGCIPGEDAHCQSPLYHELKEKYEFRMLFGVTATTDITNDRQCDDLDIFVFNYSQIYDRASGPSSGFYLNTQWELSLQPGVSGPLTVFRVFSPAYSSTSAHLEVAELAHGACAGGTRGVANYMAWANELCESAGQPVAPSRGVTMGVRRSPVPNNPTFSDIRMLVKCNDQDSPIRFIPHDPAVPNSTAVYIGAFQDCVSQILDVYFASCPGKPGFRAGTPTVTCPSDMCRAYSEGAKLSTDWQGRPGTKFINQVVRRNSWLESASLALPIASLAWSVLIVLLPRLVSRLLYGPAGGGGRPMYAVSLKPGTGPKGAVAGEGLCVPLIQHSG